MASASTDSLGVDLFNDAMTLSPLLMVAVAVLFGQKAVSEREQLANGKPVRFFRWKLSNIAAHKATVATAAAFAAIPPIVAMVGSFFGLVQDHPVGGLQLTVGIALGFQVLAAGAAVIERVTNAVPIAGE